MDDRLKFNGWDERGRWMIGWEKLAKDCMCLMPDGNGFVNTKFNTVHVNIKPLQCTGMKDEDGDLMFQGHIVEWDGIEQRAKIDFTEGGFHYDHVDGTSDYLYQRLPPKIIGNVYENPELIQAVSNNQ